MGKPRPPLGVSFEERFYIFPSETIFTQEQWKTVAAAVREGASPTEKKALLPLLRSKGLLKNLNENPRSTRGDVAAKARQLRQHYLWLLREVLELGDDVSDADIFKRAISVIRKFSLICEDGVFLPDVSRNKILEILGVFSSQSHIVPTKCTETDVIRTLKCDIQGSVDLSIWKRLQSSDVQVSPQPKKSIDLLEALIRVGLARALDMVEGSSFGVIESSRMRKSRAGRPRIEDEVEISIQDFDESPSPASSHGEHRSGYALPLNDSITPVRGEAKRTGWIPPTEEEILRKATSRILMIKDVVHSHFFLEIDVKLCGLINDWKKDIYKPVNVMFGEVLTCIWDVGRRQVAQPWAAFTPDEMLGFYDGIPPMGIWETAIKEPTSSSKDPSPLPEKATD